MKIKQNTISIRATKFNGEKNNLSQCAILAKAYLSLTRQATTTEKVLAHLVRRSIHGSFHCRKGSVQSILDSIQVSRPSYNEAIKSLIKLNVITKVNNTAYTNYPFYKISIHALSVISQSSTIEIAI